MKALYDNGYIMQRATSSGYLGVDGDNWYLNGCSNNSYFDEFYDSNIGIGWTNPDFVECCTDTEYIQRYVEESKGLGIPYRILLCSTDRTDPLLNDKPGQEGVVLGYDCAYSGGSYYSCILNDIISGRIEEFREIQLNENGLFSSYEEAEAFMQYREKLKEATSEYVYEEGDFVIYKITELKNKFF